MEKQCFRISDIHKNKVVAPVDPIEVDGSNVAVEQAEVQELAADVEDDTQGESVLAQKSNDMVENNDQNPVLLEISTTEQSETTPDSTTNPNLFRNVMAGLFLAGGLATYLWNYDYYNPDTEAPVVPGDVGDTESSTGQEAGAVVLTPAQLENRYGVDFSDSFAVGEEQMRAINDVLAHEKLGSSFKGMEFVNTQSREYGGLIPHIARDSFDLMGFEFNQDLDMSAQDTFESMVKWVYWDWINENRSSADIHQFFDITANDNITRKHVDLTSAYYVLAEYQADKVYDDGNLNYDELKDKSKEYLDSIVNTLPNGPHDINHREVFLDTLIESDILNAMKAVSGEYTIIEKVDLPLSEWISEAAWWTDTKK